MSFVDEDKIIFLVVYIALYGSGLISLTENRGIVYYKFGSFKFKTVNLHKCKTNKIYKIERTKDGEICCEVVAVKNVTNSDSDFTFNKVY